MSLLSVEHTVTFVTDFDTDKAEAEVATRFLALPEREREIMLQRMAIHFIKKEMLPKVNENNTYATLRVKE